MTKQYLNQRIYENSNNCGEKNKEISSKPALASHHLTQGHNFDFNDVEILETENYC